MSLPTTESDSDGNKLDHTINSNKFLGLCIDCAQDFQDLFATDLHMYGDGNVMH